MEWNYDSINKEWSLSDGNDIFCKVCIKKNEKAPVNKLKTKVLIHKMLCGKKKSYKMTKKNNTWYCIKEKRFNNNEEMEVYIDTKRKELLRYLKNF